MHRRGSCSYPGVTTHPVDGDQGSWGAPVCVGDACEFATIRATVGDKLIFKYPAGQGSVFRLPTAHHYAECVFGDGGVRLAGPDDGASEGGFVYEIAERDRNSELLVRLVPGHAPYPKVPLGQALCDFRVARYGLQIVAGTRCLRQVSPHTSLSGPTLCTVPPRVWRVAPKRARRFRRERSCACRSGAQLAAEGDACSKGQKIRVVVDDFQPATLSEVVSLVTSGTYRSEEEAQHLIARLWSLEAGCPTSSLGFYQGDAERAALRCRADAMSMLGFVFRKRPAADVARSEAYYNRALELHPGHCEAWSYKGMLMLDHGSLSDAVSAYNSLADLAESTAAQGAGVAALSPHPDAHICRDALVALQDKWHEKGWCFPPNQKASPCDGYSAAARVSGLGLAVLMTLPLLLLVRPV